MSDELRAAARAVVDAFEHKGLYRPHDREVLGVPPWGHTMDALGRNVLAEWESAHGHDARLPCYEEHGCLLLIGEDDVLPQIEALRAAVAAADERAALDRAVLEAARVWRDEAFRASQMFLPGEARRAAVDALAEAVDRAAGGGS